MGKLLFPIFLVTLLGGVSSQATRGDSNSGSSVNNNFTVSAGSDNARYTSNSSKIQGNELKALLNLESQSHTFENNQSLPIQTNLFTSNPGEVIQYTSSPDSQNGGLQQQNGILPWFSDPATPVQTPSSKVQPTNTRQDAQGSVDQPSGKDLGKINRSLFHSAKPSSQTTQYSSIVQPLFIERTKSDHEATDRLNVDNAQSSTLDVDKQNSQLGELSSIELSGYSQDHPSLFVSRPSKQQISDLVVLDSTPEPQNAFDNSNSTTPANILSISSSTVRSITDSQQLAQDISAEDLSQQKLRNKTNDTINGNDSNTNNQNISKETKASESPESEEKSSLLKYYPTALKSAGEQYISTSTVPGPDTNQFSDTYKSNPLINLDKSNSANQSDDDTSQSKSSVPKIGEQVLPKRIDEFNGASNLLPTVSSPKNEEVEKFVPRMDGFRSLDSPPQNPSTRVSSSENPENINSPRELQQPYQINNLPFKNGIEQDPIIYNILDYIKSSLNPLSSSLKFYPDVDQNDQISPTDRKPNPDYVIKIIPDRNNPQSPGLQLIGESLKPGFFELRGTFGLWPSLVPLLFRDKPMTIFSTNGRLQTSEPSLHNQSPNFPFSKRLQHLPISIRFVIPSGTRFGGRIKYPSDYPLSTQPVSSYSNSISSLREPDDKQDQKLGKVITSNIDFILGSIPPFKPFDPRNFINYATTTYDPTNSVPQGSFSLPNSTFPDFRNNGEITTTEIGKLGNPYYGTQNEGYSNFEYPEYSTYDDMSIIDPSRKITWPPTAPLNNNHDTLDITGDGTPKFKNPNLRYSEVVKTKYPLIYPTDNGYGINRYAPSSQMLPEEKIMESLTFPFDTTSGITNNGRPDLINPNPRYFKNNDPEELSISRIPNGLSQRDLNIPGSYTLSGRQVPGYPNSPLYTTETIHTTSGITNDGRPDLRNPNPRYFKNNDPEELSISRIPNGLPQRDLNIPGSYTLSGRQVPGYPNSPLYTTETIHTRVEDSPDLRNPSPRNPMNDKPDELAISQIPNGLPQHDLNVQHLSALPGRNTLGYPLLPLDNTETIHTRVESSPDFQNQIPKYPMNTPAKLTVSQITNGLPQRDLNIQHLFALPGRNTPGYPLSPLDNTETIHTRVEGSPDYRNQIPKYPMNTSEELTISQIMNGLPQSDLNIRRSYILPGNKIPGYPNSPLDTTETIHTRVEGSPDFRNLIPRYPMNNKPEELSISQIPYGSLQRHLSPQGPYTLPGERTPRYLNPLLDANETIYSTVDDLSSTIPRYPENDNQDELSISQIPNGIPQRDLSPSQGSFALPGNRIPGYTNSPLDTIETIHTRVEGSPNFRNRIPRDPMNNNPEEFSISQIPNGIPQRDLSKSQGSFALSGNIILPRYPNSPLDTTETFLTRIEGSPDFRKPIPKYPMNNYPGELSISQIPNAITQLDLSPSQGSFALPGNRMPEYTNSPLDTIETIHTRVEVSPNFRNRIPRDPKNNNPEEFSISQIPNGIPQRDLSPSQGSFSLPGNKTPENPNSHLDTTETILTRVEGSPDFRNPIPRYPMNYNSDELLITQILNGLPQRDRNIPGSYTLSGKQVPGFSFSPLDTTETIHNRVEGSPDVKNPVPRYPMNNNPEELSTSQIPQRGLSSQSSYTLPGRRIPGYPNVPLDTTETNRASVDGSQELKKIIPRQPINNYPEGLLNSQIPNSIAQRDLSTQGSYTFPGMRIPEYPHFPLDTTETIHPTVDGSMDFRNPILRYSKNINPVELSISLIPSGIPQRDLTIQDSYTLPGIKNTRYSKNYPPIDPTISVSPNYYPLRDLIEPKSRTLPGDKISKSPTSAEDYSFTTGGSSPTNAPHNDQNPNSTSPKPHSIYETLDGQPQQYPTTRSHTIPEKEVKGSPTSSFDVIGLPDSKNDDLSNYQRNQINEYSPYDNPKNLSNNNISGEPINPRTFDAVELPFLSNSISSNKTDQIPDNPNYLISKYSTTAKNPMIETQERLPKQDSSESGYHEISLNTLREPTTKSLEAIEIPYNPKYLVSKNSSPEQPSIHGYPFNFPDATVPDYHILPESLMNNNQLTNPPEEVPEYINDKYSNPHYGNPNNPSNLNSKNGIPQNPSGSETLNNSQKQDPIRLSYPINPERSITMSTTKPKDVTGRSDMGNNINPDDVNEKNTNLSYGNPSYPNSKYGISMNNSGSGALDSSPQPDPSKLGYPMNPERSITMSKTNTLIDVIGQLDIPEDVNEKYTNPYYENPNNPNNLNPRNGIPQNLSGSGTLVSFPKEDLIKLSYPKNTEISIAGSPLKPINPLGWLGIPNNFNPDDLHDGMYTNQNNPISPNFLNPGYNIPQNPSGAGTLVRFPQDDLIKPGYPKNDERSITGSPVKSIDPFGRLGMPNNFNPDDVNVGKYTNPNNPSNPNFLNPGYGIPQNPSGAGTLVSFPQDDRIKPSFPKNPEMSMTGSPVKSIDPFGRLGMLNNINPDDVNDGKYTNPYNPNNPNSLNPGYNIPQNPPRSGTLDSFSQQDPIKPGYPKNPEKSVAGSPVKSLDPFRWLGMPNNFNPDDLSDGKYTNTNNPSNPNYLNLRYGIPQNPPRSGTADSFSQQDPIKRGYPINPERLITMSTAIPSVENGRPFIPDYASQMSTNPYYENPSNPNYLNPRYGIPQNPSGSETLVRFPHEDLNKHGYPINPELSIAGLPVKSIDPFGRVIISDNFNPNDLNNGNYRKLYNPNNPNYFNPTYGIPLNPPGSGSLVSFLQEDLNKPGYPINTERQITGPPVKSIDPIRQLDIPNNVNPDDVNEGKYKNPNNPSNTNYLNPSHGIPQNPSGSGTLDRFLQQNPIKPDYPLDSERTITKPLDAAERLVVSEYANQKYTNPTFGSPSNPNYLNSRYDISQTPPGSGTLDGIQQDPTTPSYPLSPERSIITPTAIPIDDTGLNFTGKEIKRSPSRPFDGLGVPNIYLDSKRQEDGSIQEFPRSLSLERQMSVTPDVLFDIPPTTDTSNYGYLSNNMPLKGHPYNYLLGKPLNSEKRDNFPLFNIPSLIPKYYTDSNHPQHTVDGLPPNLIESAKQLFSPKNRRNPNIEYINDLYDGNREGSTPSQIIFGKYTLPGLPQLLERPILSTSTTNEIYVTGKPDITKKETLDSLYQSPSGSPNVDTHSELGNPKHYNDLIHYLSALYPLRQMEGFQPIFHQLLQKLYRLDHPMEYQFGMQSDPDTRLRGKTDPFLPNSQPIYPFTGALISLNGDPTKNPETQQRPFESATNIPQEPDLIKRPEENVQLFRTPNEVGEKAPHQYNVNIQPGADVSVSPDFIATGRSFQPVIQIRKPNYIWPINNNLNPKFYSTRGVSVLTNNQLNPIRSQEPNGLSKLQVNQPSSPSKSEITKPSISLEYKPDNRSQLPSDEQLSAKKGSAIKDYREDIEVPTGDSSNLIQHPGQNPLDRSQNTSTITVIPDYYEDSKDQESFTAQNPTNNETSRLIRYYPARARSNKTSSDQPSTNEQPGQHNLKLLDQIPNNPTLPFEKTNHSNPNSQPISNEPNVTMLPERADIKYPQQVVQRYDTPEFTQYNPDYYKLGERTTMGSTIVRGDVDQNYSRRTPGDPVEIYSSPKDQNRPFDQRIDSTNPSPRLVTERNAPDSASITYYGINPGSTPNEGPTADERQVYGSDKSWLPTLLPNQKMDLPEFGSEERIDEDGVIRQYGKIQHNTKGYIKYYPSNIQTDHTIGGRLAYNPHYVYSINHQAGPGADTLIPRSLSETITWPIGRSSLVSTTDESGDNAINLTGEQDPPSSALNGPSRLFSAKRFINSVDINSRNEISLPDNLEAGTLQAKSAATTMSFPVGGSATVSTVSNVIPLQNSSQSQGIGNITTFSYPASSFNTHYSMNPIQYLTKPVTTQVRYSIFPASFRSASGAQSGPALTSQTLGGLKKTLIQPILMNLPKGKQAGVTRGKYTYTGPDGKTVTTNWFVDETGFHVEDNQNTPTEAPKTSSEHPETN